MNWKIVLPALLITAAALGGCGGDDCTTASDHLAACAVTTTSASTGMMMDMACSGVPLCQAQCENQYTCTQINGNDPSFTACMNLCKGK